MIPLVAYARRPFLIEAVQVTKKNIEELNKEYHLGELLKTNRGVPFIRANPSVVPHVFRIYPGFWFTKTETGLIRCYSKRTFSEQYMLLDSTTRDVLEAYMRKDPVVSAEEAELELVAEDIIEPEGSQTMEEVAQKSEPVEENLFDGPPPIPPGGTYTPGELSKPKTDPAEAKRVTDEVHLAEPAEESPS